MNAYPFSIFKRADRSCYSVSFKDENGKYLRPVSTGKKTEKEALEIAFKWLHDGIPQKNVAVRVSDLSMKDMVLIAFPVHPSGYNKSAPTNLPIETAVASSTSPLN